MDGFRSLSILVVLLAHLLPQINVPVVTKVAGVVDGHLGVTFFFVISGFLITLLLLRQFRQSGTISLKQFYLRRTLRIVPAFAFYLAVIFGIQAYRGTYFEWQYWAAAGTYTMCYLPKFSMAWEIGHTWSLSVEEHFYLIWPFLFRRLEPQGALKWLLAYLLALPVIRLGIWSLGLPWLDIDYCSLTQMGSIGVGCVAAYIVRGAAFPRLAYALSRNPGGALLGGVLLLAASLAAGTSGKYAIALGDPINAVSLALILMASLYGKDTRWFRCMNSRPLVVIGTLSYSIYLWQQPLSGEGMFANSLPHWVLNLPLIAVCAVASYYLIEQPFLRLKDGSPHRSA